MSVFTNYKADILKLYEDSRNLVNQLNVHEVHEQLVAEDKHLREGKLYVVVCGEIKQGKSSLVNALVNEPGLFPVDQDVTTALVSAITYGQQEKITVVLDQEGSEVEHIISREEIADYVSEQRNPDNARNARMLIVQMPKEILREGILLIDTPGVGGLNRRHIDISYAFIPNADVVIFVSDAVTPLTTDELEFLKTINRYTPHILFTFTKIDMQADYEETVANNRIMIANTLNVLPENLIAVPVSSKLKLDYLTSQSIEDLEDSGYPAFEAKLWEFLSSKGGYILLRRALTTLYDLMQRVKIPLLTEWQTYKQDSEAEIAKLQNTLISSRSRLKELSENNALWRETLRRGIRQIRIATMDELADGFRRVRRHCDDLLDENPNNPEGILTTLQSEMNMLITDIAHKLGEASQVLQDDVEKQADLNLEIFLDGDNISLTAWEGIGRRYRGSNVLDRTFSAARAGTITAATAGALGALTGGAVGALVGTLTGGFAAPIGWSIGQLIGGFVGSATGLISGTLRGLRQDTNRDRNQARTLYGRRLHDYVEDNLNNAKRHLTTVIDALEDNMTAGLRSKISLERQTVERAIQAIEKAQKIAKTERETRAREVKEQVSLINDIQNQANLLIEQLSIAVEDLKITSLDRL